MIDLLVGGSNPAGRQGLAPKGLTISLESSLVSTSIDGKYVLMDVTATYSDGVHNLQEACRREGNSVHPQFVMTECGIYRPLTFKENLQAWVNDYETNQRDKLGLFRTGLDSCCGIVYKGGTTNFKVVPICEELITIPQGFNQRFLSVDYDSVPGIELDSSKAKYNTLLTQEEVLEHPAWLTVIEEDRVLLKAYTDIVFTERGGKNMTFWVLNKPPQDQLRSLFFISLDYYSNADDYYLYYRSSFLRVAPHGAP